MHATADGCIPTHPVKYIYVYIPDWVRQGESVVKIAADAQIA